MLFRALDGQLMLTLHSPNTNPNERPEFYPHPRGGRKSSPGNPLIYCLLHKYSHRGWNKEPAGITCRLFIAAQAGLFCHSWIIFSFCFSLFTNPSSIMLHFILLYMQHIEYATYIKVKV